MAIVWETGIIRSGDVQWMTAGSGVIRQEMPKGDDAGRMWGFQLWANLPAAHKMMHPRYQEVTSSQIPAISTGGGGTIRVICGEVNGTKGPVQDIVTDPEYLDVTVPPHSEFIHATKPRHTVFAYVIEGKACFCPDMTPSSSEVKGGDFSEDQRNSVASNESLVLFDRGEHVAVATEDQAVCFLLISGRPIGEPVAWYGPIVMNYREELQIAFDEYRNGTFLKHQKA